MPEVMTCKCGCQSWLIDGIQAQCDKCKFLVPIEFIAENPIYTINDWIKNK